MALTVLAFVVCRFQMLPDKYTYVVFVLWIYYVMDFVCVNLYKKSFIEFFKV